MLARRELVTEGIEKDKAINEIRAMSNFIGRIGHKVTEYHSIEERKTCKIDKNSHVDLNFDVGVLIY